MNTLKINGKDYKISVTYGKFEKTAKYQEKHNTDESFNNGDYLIYSIWTYLERRFIFKPFFFKFIDLIDQRN